MWVVVVVVVVVVTTMLPLRVLCREHQPRVRMQTNRLPMQPSWMLMSLPHCPQSHAVVYYYLVLVAVAWQRVVVEAGDLPLPWRDERIGRVIV
jgi:hypothetical protein